MSEKAAHSFSCERLCRTCFIPCKGLAVWNICIEIKALRVVMALHLLSVFISYKIIPTSATQRSTGGSTSGICSSISSTTTVFSSTTRPHPSGDQPHHLRVMLTVEVISTKDFMSAAEVVFIFHSVRGSGSLMPKGKGWYRGTANRREDRTMLHAESPLVS